MAFMRPATVHMVCYHEDTNCGTELIPEEVCGKIDLEAEPTREEWDRVLQYCEGNRIEGIERKEGWYARLSAPGYLDCTEWTGGPYDTEAEALEAVRIVYGVDDNGDSVDQ